MTVLTTTTVSIFRPAAGADPYEAESLTGVAAGLTAHLSDPSGSERDRGGELERIQAVALIDGLVDLTHTDVLIDDASGDRYRVSWVRQRRGLGLDHTKAGLVAYDGGSGG